MHCSNCNHPDSKVIDSRSIQSGNCIRRRRECLNCSFRFTTYEYIATTPIMIVKKNGTREEFDRQKLERSFHIACNKRPVSEEMILEAIKRLEEAESIGAKSAIYEEFEDWIELEDKDEIEYISLEDQSWGEQEIDTL